MIAFTFRPHSPSGLKTAGDISALLFSASAEANIVL